MKHTESANLTFLCQKKQVLTPNSWNVSVLHTEDSVVKFLKTYNMPMRLDFLNKACCLQFTYYDIVTFLPLLTLSNSHGLLTFIHKKCFKQITCTIVPPELPNGFSLSFVFSLFSSLSWMRGVLQERTYSDLQQGHWPGSCIDVLVVRMGWSKNRYYKKTTSCEVRYIESSSQPWIMSSMESG